MSYLLAIVDRKRAVQFALVVLVLCFISTKGFIRPTFFHNRNAPHVATYEPIKLQLVSKKTHESMVTSLQFRTSNNDNMERVAVVTELENEDEEDDVAEEVFESHILRKLSKAVVPLSVSIGFAATPSSKVALRVAGAAAGGVVGLFARSAIRRVGIKPKVEILGDGRFSDDSNDAGGSGIPAAVKKTITELLYLDADVLQLTVSDMETLARKNRVPENQLGLLFTCMFAEAAFRAVTDPAMTLTELSEVLAFAEANALTEAEIGDGFVLAANKIGRLLDRDEKGFYSEEYPLEVLQQAARLLFLADKMIGSVQGFYGKRMIPAMAYFPTEYYRDIITEECRKIFGRCIEGVLTAPEKYTEATVLQLKEFLTTSPAVSSLRSANMQHMVLDAVQLILDQTLSPTASPMHAKVENYDRFVQALPLLGWHSRELSQTLESRTSPLFEKAVRSLFKQVQEKPQLAAELSSVLLERVEALKIDPRKARVLITTIISEMNAEYMNRIDKVYNASGGAVEPAYKIMVTYAHTHDALRTLASPVMQEVALPLPGLPFKDMVRANMYQAQLTKSGSAGSTSTDRDLETTAGVKTEMFDLTDAQRMLVRKHLALPKITSWIQQCIAEGNFNPHAQSAYQKLLDTHNITAQEWTATAVDFYYQEVKRIATARAVPTQADTDRLGELHRFLQCPAEIVAKVHLELLGDKYIKALTESMTPTGVVTEEYSAGLARLRDRLGLAANDAESLFNVAVRARVSPIIRDLADIWKSDTDANYRTEKNKKKTVSERENRPKDKSGDPISSPDNVFGYMDTEKGGQKDGGGPNVFMREALNLVDFLVKNHRLLDKDVGAFGDLKITAAGVVPEADLAGMFKHYLITRLMVQDVQLRARYVQVEPLFARVLGITPQGQGRIKESLAYTVYKNLLLNNLRYQDEVDSQHLQQFAQLSGGLGLDKEVAEKVSAEATRGAVVEHAAKLIRPADSGDTFLTSDVATRLRKQVMSLGLDMRKDAGFNDHMLTYMFALEVQELVSQGLEDQFSDLQQAYDLPEQRAAEIIEATCKRYISQLLNLALRAAKKYDERDTILWTKRLLKYVVFVSGTVQADGNLFSAADKKRLVAFYQAELESAEDKEIVALAAQHGDLTQRLRDLIHLSADYVAPLQGIEGLLGNVKSLAQLEQDMNADTGKKAWAWG